MPEAQPPRAHQIDAAAGEADDVFANSRSYGESVRHLAGGARSGRDSAFYAGGAALVGLDRDPDRINHHLRAWLLCVEDATRPRRAGLPLRFGNWRLER